MSRSVVWSALWLVFGCGGSTTEDDNVYVAPSFITGSDTTTMTESDGNGTMDTGDFGAADPLVPPTDVDSDCWSWKIFYEDGSPEDTQLRMYDGLPDPNVLYYEIDEGPNGRINEVANFEYLDGQQTLAWYDEDNDGMPDREYRTTFDADGNALTYWFLEDGEIEYWVYTLDADGNRERLDVDEGDNGTIDIVWRYTYDSLDRRERIEGDRGDNGTVDELYTYDWPGTQDRLYTRRYFDDPSSPPASVATIRMSDDDRYLERKKRTMRSTSGTSTNTTGTTTYGAWTVRSNKLGAGPTPSCTRSSGTMRTGSRARPTTTTWKVSRTRVLCARWCTTGTATSSPQPSNRRTAMTEAITPAMSGSEACPNSVSDAVYADASEVHREDVERRLGGTVHRARKLADEAIGSVRL